MRGTVRLLVNNVPYDETNTAPDNTFKFDNVVLPSAFSIGMIATATQGMRTFSANKSIPWSTQTPGNPLQSATPNSTPAPCAVPSPSPSAIPVPVPIQATVVRNLSSLVSYKGLDVNISVELPKDDPRAVSLMIRKLTLPEFIRRVFLDFTINGLPIDYRFQEVNPEIETSASSVIVRASSNPKYRSFAPTPDGDLIIGPGWRPENKNDAITLTVADYAVRSLDPAPYATSHDSLTWVGDQKLSNIKIGLNYDWVGSAPKLLRLFRLSPYEIVPFSASSIVATALGLLVAVPIIWFLLILPKYQESSGMGKQFTERLQFSSRLFLAIIFSAPAIYSMYNLAGRINSLLARSSHGFKNDDDFRLLVITALVMWLLFLMLTSACTLIPYKRAALWLHLVLRGIRDAWTLTLYILIIIGFTLTFVPIDRIGTPRWLSASLAWAIIFVLSVIVLKLYRTTEGEDSPWLSRRTMAFIFVLLALLVLALVDPRPPASLFVVISKRQTPTLTYLRTFLFFLRDLMPYAILPGITILLWRVEKRGGMSDPLALHIAKLLFVGFLVGATPNLFLIPVPFFIALWIFPRYVIQSPSTCQDVDSIRSDVFVKRKEKLKTIIRPSESRRLQESLEQLERNVLAGEVSSDEYGRLKTEIENRLSKIRQDNVLQNELKVEDVVVGIGLRKTNWENGKWAAIRGALLALPFSGLYLWELLQRTTWPLQAYFLLGLVIPLITFIAYWTVCAFFFGYFFPYLRGKSGLRKGLIVSASVILCLLIVWILSLSSSYALFLRVGQTFLFFTLLGLWSDYKSFRDAVGAEFNWKEFAQFEYIPSLAAFGSIALASLSTAVNSVMQDHYQLIIRQLVGMVSQQFPQLPPPPH